ncbi:MAG: hypothetical protein ACLVC5_09165 [Clostridia bacterium]
MLAIPVQAVDVATMVLIVVTAVDMTISGEALDLKAMLIKKGRKQRGAAKAAEPNRFRLCPARRPAQI